MTIFKVPPPAHNWAFTRADSIENFFKHNPSVSEKLMHFDPTIVAAIEDAYFELGGLHLLRYNRKDIKKEFSQVKIPFNRISLIRDIISEKDCGRYPISIQNNVEAFQQTRAAVTKEAFEALLNGEYHANFLSPFAAYCEEHAYLLLAALLTKGVPSNCLRVVNLEAQMIDSSGKTSHDNHSYIIYNSHGFNTADNFYSSVLPVIKAHPENTIFLDPWSKEKIHSFSKNTNRHDFKIIFRNMMREVKPNSTIRHVELEIDSYHTSTAADNCGTPEIQTPTKACPMHHL